MTSRPREPWILSDHFDWLTGYLAGRDSQRSVALLIGGLVLTLGVLELLMLCSPDGPQTFPTRVTAGVVAGVCGLLGLLWLRPRWPTRGESTVFVVVAALAITTACLIESNPRSGLVCAVLFALLGGYGGFFHSPLLMAFDIALGSGTVTLLAYRIFLTDPALAVVKMLVVIAVIMAVPLMCQVMLDLLGADVADSDIDPLTGVLNRRGFYRRVDVLFARWGNPGDRYLTIVMIDLDRFKRLNDTEGHAAGDRALTAVSRSLLASCPAGGLIARIGGEEFLLAYTSAAVNAAEFGERVRQAVRCTPPRLSASVGTVTVRLINPGPGCTSGPIDTLIALADEAMYEAKRAGGNRSCNRSVDVGAVFGDPVAPPVRAPWRSPP